MTVKVQRLRRSMIEVPGNVERMLDKARDFPVDVLMLDLEDSVPADDAAKVVARENIDRVVTEKWFNPRELVIRINRPGHPWCLEDVALAARLGVDGIVVPKVYSVAEYLFVEHYLDLVDAPPDLLIHLCVETPAALVGLDEIATKARRLTSVAAGGFDYLLELGSHSLKLDAESSAHAQQELVVARQLTLAVARAHGLTAVDGQLAINPKDPVEVEAVARQSRQMGFDGGALYHPAQIDICNRVFGPDEQEVAWAHEVVAAVAAARQAGRAAVIHNGEVLLPQHEKLAKATLELAAVIGRPDTD